MKIIAIEDLHANAGWRDFSFLKVTTDAGITGWSEYMEGYGSPGLTGVIRRLAAYLIGEDPRPYERHMARLRAAVRHAPSGMAHQAVAALENALVDVKAKALGVPVSALFGGPIRDRLPVYWSHCGSYRLDNHAAMGTPPLASLDDVYKLGREVRDRGFGGLKTNIFLFDGDRPRLHMPGFNRSPGGPELNADDALVEGIVDQMEAFREGAGPGVALKLDLNFNFKPEGYRKIARALAHLNMDWLELDNTDPVALKSVRDVAPMAIASLESLFGRREYKPFLDARAVDVAIIDVPWNGIGESMRIASLAETYEVNVAAHNFNGHLGSLMGAHFCASVPNFRVLEIDVEDVTWRDSLFTHPPVLENGALILPDRPGWGTDVDEAAVAAHPPANKSWLGEAG